MNQQRITKLPVRVFPVLLLSAMLLSTFPAYAQIHDTKGKEFWVVFMENFGSGGTLETSDLRLYLNCEQASRARIEYMANGKVLEVPLPTPNVPVEVNIAAEFGNVELRGSSPMVSEITSKTFRITADDEITLYGVNIRSKSSDAFLSLPEDVLTRSYYVISYPNGYIGYYDMQSEFAVIGTEDGTTVTITSPAGINGRPAGLPFTVGLNRGEVFFGQAALLGEQDVTGTTVKANKPVAVYGGNKRTSIPTTVANFRDHLVEQMPPVDAWGNEALLTPHYKITPNSIYRAIARVLAALDGTTVTVTRPSGTSTYFLDAGEVLELDTLEAMHVKADNPILVAQFEHSVGFDAPGDPFMMLIPPPEQFDTAYSFQSIRHLREFDSHYVNVIVPTGAVGSLRLDGAPVTAQPYPIPGGTYSYMQVKLDAGAHHIRADAGFGLCAYGYGHANSYGYSGGMLFQKLVHDFQPPEMLRAEQCRLLEGVFFDAHLTDLGIDSCYTTQTTNVNVTIEPFPLGSDTVHFNAQLLDPYQDGIVGIKAIDGGGRSRTANTLIPGFTLRTAGPAPIPSLWSDTVISYNGKPYCRAVVIENYGMAPRTITEASLDLSTPGLTVRGPFPLTIPPGETRLIDVCFEGELDTTLLAMLTIADTCNQRDVAMIPFTGRVDTTAPDIGREVDPCGDEVLLTFTELLGLESGIGAVYLDSLVNCEVVSSPGAGDLPANSVLIRLRRINPRYDMIYQIALRDVADNITVERDTIGGFTVAIVDEVGDTLSVERNLGWSGNELSLTRTRCDSITLANYGLRPLYIEHCRMDGNLVYSIPQSQLPLMIPPGETRKLAVCIEGGRAADQFDTLVVHDGCGRLERVGMKLPVIYGEGSGNDQCNNSIGIQVFAPSKRTFLTVPVPNPATGSSAHVDVALSRAEKVSLEVMDLQGTPVNVVLRNIELGAGINRVEFDLSTLTNGTYFCVMTTGSGETYVHKFVVGR